MRTLHRLAVGNMATECGLRCQSPRPPSFGRRIPPHRRGYLGGVEKLGFCYHRMSAGLNCERVHGEDLIKHAQLTLVPASKDRDRAQKKSQVVGW